MSLWSKEELDAAYGDLPLERAWEGLRSTLGGRLDTAVTALDNPSLGVPEKAAHTLAQTGGMLLDTAAAPLGFALDAIIPGTPMDTVMKAAVESGVGQQAMEKWKSIAPEDKARISSGLVPLEALAALFGVNSIARNARANVPGFYSGNPVGQIAGIGDAFAVKGTSSALREAISPVGQALKREGFPQGARDEINHIAFLVNKYDEVVGKKKAGTKLSADEEKIFREISTFGGKDSIPSAGKLKSYIEGTLVTRMNIMKQQGMDTGIMEAFVEQPLATNISKLSDASSIRNSLGAMPTTVKDRLLNHVKATWDLNKKRQREPIIITRAANNNLAGEAVGLQAGKGTRQSRISSAFQDSEKFKGQMKKHGFDKFDSAEDVKEFLSVTQLTPKDQAKWIQLNKKGSDLTKVEAKTKSRIEGLLKDYHKVGREGEDGWVYFSDSHLSADKAYGGVNTFSGVNWKTGEAYSAISDKSDMLGIDGLGARPLVTIVEPVNYNIYDPKLNLRTGGKGRSTAAEAVERTVKATGVEPRKPLPKGATLWDQYATTLSQDYRPKPTRKDYVTAAGNVGALGATGGMLTANRLINNNKEE